MATATGKTTGVVCDERELVRALARCKQVVSKRALTPVLGAVRLWRSGNDLMMEGVDMGRVAVRVYLRGQVKGRFDAVVPLDAWAGAMKSLRGLGDIRLVSTRSGVIASAGRRRLTLPLVDDQWPPLDFDGAGTRIVHAVGAAVAVASETVVAFAGDDEQRPLVPCAHLELGRGEIWATDAYSLGAAVLPGVLAEAQLPEGELGGNGTIHVDARALAIATAKLDDAAGVVMDLRAQDLVVRIPGAVYVLTRHLDEWNLVDQLKDIPWVVSTTVAYDELYEAVAAAGDALGRDGALTLLVARERLVLTGKTSEGHTFTQRLVADARARSPEVDAAWSDADAIRQGAPTRMKLEDAGKYAREANKKLDERAHFRVRSVGRAHRLVGGLPAQHLFNAARLLKLLHVMDASDEVTLELAGTHDSRPMTVRSGPDWAVLMPLHS